MRARMAIKVAGQACELREIKLANKPAEFLEASPKATVPVVVESDGNVIEQSLDIMLWALGRRDPEQWLCPQSGDRQQMLDLIAWLDGPFKSNLDRYKYAPRYAQENDGQGVDPLHHRSEAIRLLGHLEGRLARSEFLFGDRAALADFAIAPFVRQFANVDADWFATQPLPKVHTWLSAFLGSDIFLSCMTKYTPWISGTEGIAFPE